MNMKADYKFTDAQELWLSCLEEDGLPQTTGRLQKKEGYCCLGVACFLYEHYHNKPLDPNGFGMFSGLVLDGKRSPVKDWLGLRDVCGTPVWWSTPSGPLRTLMALNDIEGYTFKQIAAVIRKNPRAYFKEVEDEK